MGDGFDEIRGLIAEAKSQHLLSDDEREELVDLGDVTHSADVYLAKSLEKLTDIVQRINQKCGQR
jgi:dephospho-CoA kinase